MVGKTTLLSLLYCAKTSNGRKFYITMITTTSVLHKQEIAEKSTVLLFCGKKTSNGRKVYIAVTFVLWIKKTSNGRKVYIAITFVLCKEYIHKSRLLSLLYCVKTFNGRKVYIAITFVLCKEHIQW